MPSSMMPLSELEYRQSLHVMWDTAPTLKPCMVKGMAETVNMHHIRHHYYESHTTINPTGIVPAGARPPLLDLSR